MDFSVRDITVHYEEAGTGRPILILHGWPGDGRTTMPEFEPFFEGRPGWRRIYPDVTGIVRTPVPEWLKGPDDALDVLIEFMAAIAPMERFSVAGVSKGAYFAMGIVHHATDQIDGALFSVPLLEYFREHPEHPRPEHVVLQESPAMVADLRPGEEWLLEYLVVQSPSALGAVRKWEWPPAADPASKAVFANRFFSFDPTVLTSPCLAPVLMLLGRQDHENGFRKGWAMIEQFPRGTFAVLDSAGHLLDVEQPILRAALINDWLDRVEANARERADHTAAQ